MRFLFFPSTSLQWLRMLGLCLLTLAGPVLAGPVPFASRQAVQIDVMNVPLAKFLFDLFSEQGVPVVVSESLVGSVTARFNASPERILNDLAKQFGFVYYHDGNAVYVTHLSEQASAMLWLEPADLARVIRFVEVLGLRDTRFKFTPSVEDGYLLVAGPPRYVAQIREVVSSVKNSPPSVFGRLQTRIFRLKYASAADSPTGAANGAQSANRTPRAGGQGVASVLARMMGVELLDTYSPSVRVPANVGRRMAGALAAGSAGSAQPDGRPAANELARDSQPADGRGAEYAGPSASRARAGSAVPELPSDGPPTRAAGTQPTPLRPIRPQDTVRREDGAEQNPWQRYADGGTPMVMGEPQLNAVIVRDEARKMPQYEELVALLDVAPQMIEIEATIIDIDSNRLEQLGIDLKLETSNISILGSAAGRGGVLNSDSPPQVSGNGLVAQALLGSVGNSLVARITALSQSGDARIVSRPRIVTMNSVGAVLSNTKEFNVKVAGERQADLFNVSYGLNLQVTPLVVGDSKAPEFRLLVQIEDGNSQVASVDGIPVITRSSLDTQSLIRQGESLLVGGYVVDEVSNGADKVPFLSDLPVIGALFGEKRNSRRRTERLFLITPRLIDRGDAQKAQALLSAPEVSMSNESVLSRDLILSRDLKLPEKKSGPTPERGK
jgi:type III secretion protein C